MENIPDMQTVIEIRRDVPQSKAPLVHPDGAARYVCDDEALLRKHAKDTKAADAAFLARAAVHGGRPDDVYEANVALREAERKQDETNAEVLDWLSANIDRKLAESRAADEALAAEGVALLDALELRLQEAERRRYSIALVARGKSLATPFRPEPAKRIPGGSSLANLRAGLRALLPTTPVERIPQAEYLQRRDDGEDMTRYGIVHTPGGKFGPRGSGS